MRPLTEEEIRSSFVNAHEGELERLPLPGLHEMIWDQREYLGWRDPQASRRGYIVHWVNGVPTGIVLKAAPGGMRHGIAALCSLCHSPQPATQVRLFTAPRAGDAGRNGDTVGSYICEDLACSLLIRAAPEHLNPPERVARRREELVHRVRGLTAAVQRSS